MKRRIFVGSSGEAIAVCRAVQAELEDDFDVTIWDQDVFRLSYGALIPCSKPWIRPTPASSSSGRTT